MFVDEGSHGTNRAVLFGPVRTNVSCAANYNCAPHEVPQTFVHGSTLHTPSYCGGKGLNVVPQAVPVSPCQQIVHQTSCGTDILASVVQLSIVLEVVVL